SDLLGPLKLGQPQGEVFLGRDLGHQANYSDEVASRIDAEIRLIIDSAHTEARAILTTHRATLDRLAAALIEKETLDSPELTAILGDLPPWPSRSVSANGNGARTGARRRSSRAPKPSRSEEHTSELQSRFDLVCR